MVSWCLHIGHVKSDSETRGRWRQYVVLDSRKTDHLSAVMCKRLHVDRQGRRSRQRLHLLPQKIPLFPESGNVQVHVAFKGDAPHHLVVSSQRGGPSASYFLTPTLGCYYCQDKLSITLALCLSVSPRFSILSSTHDVIKHDPGLDGSEDVREIEPQDGFASWTGASLSGVYLRWGAASSCLIQGWRIQQWFFLSDNVPATPQATTPSSSQQLHQSIAGPQYPNYILSTANNCLPDPPSSPPNLTLVVTQTSSTPLFRTVCFFDPSAISTTSSIVSSSLWLCGPQDKWGIEYFLGGLASSTNYTAFIIQAPHRVSGLMNFLTRSASFARLLIHTLPSFPSTNIRPPTPCPSQH
ncbi:hypothetical protein P691DRAFT_849790 [Macrolepiota fuliginosa MF-IS2]|uniref:Uncharacterized protein n=1 Tax=Macrolepiota fuliginosa MF-IS2 TaxID=1400762 RepID=A0A9P5X2E9_9AGAR|nr:hypothetical protein P691DRAFT_849790 [Macrolepiota fuliginosa MF-IS2]